MLLSQTRPSPRWAAVRRARVCGGCRDGEALGGGIARQAQSGDQTKRFNRINSKNNIEK